MERENIIFFSPLRKGEEESDPEYFIINIGNEIDSLYENNLSIILENFKEEKKEETNHNKENILIKNIIKPKRKRKKGKKKIYKCICGKEFHTKENQTLHFKNIHLKIKPYQCSFCGSKFSHRNGKNYHERTFHTFIFPYKCNFANCNCQFASKSSLNYHMKNKHSNI